MASDVYITVIESCEGARNRTGLKTRRHVEQLRASGPLNIVAIDILGLLQKTRTGNLFIVVITNQYTKITLDIASSKLDVAPVSSNFFDQ